MAYYTNLFSPGTYEAFSKSDRTISGFQESQWSAARRIKQGDIFVCYMTRLSRWVGLLEVLEGPFRDDTPIFYAENDPFVVRFRVRPLIWLPKEHAVPIFEDELWNNLSFTKGQDRRTSRWTAAVRRSLNQLDPEDGLLLERILREQAEQRRVFEVDEKEYRRYLRHPVSTGTKMVEVSVPDESDVESAGVQAERAQPRESVQIQALLARIGAAMGLRIWIPRNDRAAVSTEWTPEPGQLLDVLPFSYDETTLKTVEQIDVIWIHRRSIARAFEVEHTTSIYSGLLRMADLLALQPNIGIKLHIVAPASRRAKVFQEIVRPVFSLLEGGPLADRCSYLSYESVRKHRCAPASCVHFARYHR